jgi:hypothetical protein
MIVRDAGSCWQVVLQTDHADLSGDLARAWRDLVTARESVIFASERHDDGWAVWERAPIVETETGKPVNFLDVHVSAHLAFYRACITAVTDQDPYAGLLVSMHGAGIYRQRYGSDVNTKLNREPEAMREIDAFVEEQEASYAARIEALGISDEERWANYFLLELFDRLSLYPCMHDVERGEAASIGEYRIEPVSPWTVRMDPYPFEGDSATFSLRRRMIPKRDDWRNPTFAREFFAVEPETVELVINA